MPLKIVVLEIIEEWEERELVLCVCVNEVSM